MYHRLKRIEGNEVTYTLISNQKRVSIQGQEFSSLKDAMCQLGVAKSTLSRRLKSPKYPEWFYIEKTRSNDYPERE